MHELKKRLRAELIAQRQAMDKALKERADRDIFEQLLLMVDAAKSVFTYASTPIEVDTRRVIDYCLEKGIPTALPVSGDTELDFYYIENTGELSRGRFGIDEPLKIRKAAADKNTLCIVPALCADGLGYRLGYGRGYYDRFLSGFEGTSVIICYKDFKRVVPTEFHDKKADYTIFDRTGKYAGKRRKLY